MNLTLYLEYFKQYHYEINHIYHIFDEEPSNYFIRFFLRSRRIINKFATNDSKILLEDKLVNIGTTIIPIQTVIFIR